MPAKSPLDVASLPCGADVDLLLEQAATGRGAAGTSTSAAACTAAVRVVAALAEWRRPSVTRSGCGT